MKLIKLLVVSLLFFTVNSCASLYTTKSHYIDIDMHLAQGSSDSALKALQVVKDSSYTEKDKVLYFLEEGMLFRYAGLYKESNVSLTKAEYAIEDLLTKSISKGVLSGVLNDNALEYPGEDYENIYINIFKALNYLQLNNLEDALIEIRRVNFKLTQLETKYSGEINDLNNSEDFDVPLAELSFHNDALARYLGIIAYRLDGLLDDARIESDYLEKAYRYQDEIYNFTPPTFPDISNEETYVNLFAFTGFPPEKIANTIIANGKSGSLYLGDNTGLPFNSLHFPGVRSNTVLKLEFPNLVKTVDPVNNVKIYINGEYYDKLELIEAFDNISLEAFKLKQPLIIGKTVIRAISKSIVSDVSESVIEDRYGFFAGLLADLAGDVFMVVSENSDLRASHYFPSNIRGLEIVMEPGFYDFTYVYYNNANYELYREDFNNVEIKYRDLNIIESHLLRKE
ncbi:MAG: hypothetical protein OCD02_09135 [Spirochaetaceae bacterium]